jgi:hypothetical protein
MKSLSMLLIAAFTMLTVSVSGQGKENNKDSSKTTTIYTCPMHHSVTMKQPGKCSICGMELTKKEVKETQTPTLYSCPMHPEISSDKTGKCSKCKMDLVPAPKDKTEMAKVYSCPMKCEGDKTYDNPGNCPKCGMSLKEKKPEPSGHKH